MKLAALIGIVILLGLAAGCAPSPEQVATMTAAAWTPTPAATLTPTPIPYDLTVHIADEAGSPIAGASIVLPESGSDQPVETDAAGQYTWTNLRGPSISLTVSAPGYVSAVQPVMLDIGQTEMALILHRDAFALLPSDACAPGEKLVYLEDYQDGKAQGWRNMTAATDFAAQNGWSIAETDEGNSVAAFTGGHEDLDDLEGMTFDNFVWRLKFQAQGTDGFSFINLKHAPQEGGESRYPLQWGANVLLDLTRLQMPSPGHMSVARSDFQAEQGKWYYAELSVYQGAIQIWVDGQKLIEYQDPQPLPAGMISLEAHAPNDPNTVYYFDDLSVCELTSPFTASLYKEPEQ